MKGFHSAIQKQLIQFNNAWQNVKHCCQTLGTSVPGVEAEILTATGVLDYQLQELLLKTTEQMEIFARETTDTASTVTQLPLEHVIGSSIQGGLHVGPLQFSHNTDWCIVCGNRNDFTRATQIIGSKCFDFASKHQFRSFLSVLKHSATY